MSASPDTCEAPAARRACVLAEALGALHRLGVRDRGLVDRILRATLAANPRSLGVWSVWEPNAFDGRDAEHVGAPGHDETGRYVPLWTRGAGTFVVEPNSSYDTGEWYVTPMRTRSEHVCDPYEYPIAGARRLITTQVAPIVREGVCLGVAGIDFQVADIPRTEAVDNPVEELLDRGFVFLERSARMRWCTPRSRRVLHEFFDTGGDELPASLRRRLDEDKWPARGGGPGVWVDGRAGALEVRPFDHPDTGPGLSLVRRPARAPSPLSAREHEVWSWMAEGKSNPEIASILDVSVHTVKRHVEHILRKLGAPNRSAAALMFVGPSTYRARGANAGSVPS